MKIFLTLMLAAGIGCFAAAGVRADHNGHPEVVRAIKAHAEEVKRDAAIYQRRRVSSGVAHVIEDTKKLEKSMNKHSCLKADIDAIHKAVSDLRSACIESDPNKIADIVKRLSNLSDGVLRKYCKDDASSK